MNEFPVQARSGPAGVRTTLRLVAGRYDGDELTGVLYRWDAAAGTGVIFAEGRLTVERRGTRWTLRTFDGVEWTVTRQNGCACGHPLRHWTPRPARAYAS